MSQGFCCTLNFYRVSPKSCAVWCNNSLMRVGTICAIQLWKLKYKVTNASSKLTPSVTPFSGEQIQCLKHRRLCILSDSYFSSSGWHLSACPESQPAWFLVPAYFTVCHLSQTPDLSVTAAHLCVLCFAYANPTVMLGKAVRTPRAGPESALPALFMVGVGKQRICVNEHLNLESAFPCSLVTHASRKQLLPGGLLKGPHCQKFSVLFSTPFLVLFGRKEVQGLGYCLLEPIE